MSTNWIKGSRCGTDNCRTHYYKIFDGQRVCQYGHVFEGHIEFNDDDDDNFVLTRRLNIPNPSQVKQSQLGKRKESTVLYGPAGREVLYKCYQSVLRSQTKAFIKLFKLDKVFENVVKKVWIEYLNKIVKFDDKWKQVPPFMDTLVILYLSCRYLQLPIYINDFIQLVITNKIPFMRASQELPPNLKIKLIGTYHLMFEPRKPPLKGDLCIAIAKVHTKLGWNLKFNYEPLLLRLVNQMVLPPRIYKGVKECVKLFGLEFDIPKVTNLRATHVYKFPEIKLISIVILITKLYFMNYQKLDIPNYKIWLLIIQNKNDEFNELLKDLLTTEQNELPNWEDSQVYKYLDWFEESFVREKDDPAMKRLYNLFELNKEEEDLEELKEQEIAANLNSVETSFKQLLKNHENLKKAEMTKRGILQIEQCFSEKLTSFGVTSYQIKRSAKVLETELLKLDKLLKVTQK